MQCLRLAAFLSRPTLLVIQTLLMMGPYLTNSGKFLDASALFALTARLAQALDGESALSVLPTYACFVRSLQASCTLP